MNSNCSTEIKDIEAQIALLQERKKKLKKIESQERAKQNDCDLLNLFPHAKNHWKVETFLIPTKHFLVIKKWVEEKKLDFKIPDGPTQIGHGS